MIPRFRVWLPDLDQMLRVKALVFEKDKTRCVCGYSFDFYLEDENATIMQSTGLFDKEGQEIFEGDIVRFFDSLYTVFYDIKEGSYRLKPHDDRWVVDYMSNFSSEESFEVVGNIYENPELMEEKK